jgi:hypothetical protein
VWLREIGPRILPQSHKNGVNDTPNDGLDDRQKSVSLESHQRREPVDGSTSKEEEETMKVWYRGAALASVALLWAGAHVGAQIRETVGLPSTQPKGTGLAERPHHPVVLLNTREGEFSGGERIVAQFMLKQLDPEGAVARVSPPKGIDGIIAYPGSRMLMVRGTREAVAGYRASLEKLDRQAGAREPGEGRPSLDEDETSAVRPFILVPSSGKFSLKADRVEQGGKGMEATGHVVLGLPDGIELRAQQVRVTTNGGRQRIVIEK